MRLTKPQQVGWSSPASCPSQTQRPSAKRFGPLVETGTRDGSDLFNLLGHPDRLWISYMSNDAPHPAGLMLVLRTSDWNVDHHTIRISHLIKVPDVQILWVSERNCPFSCIIAPQTVHGGIASQLLVGLFCPDQGLTGRLRLHFSQNIPTLQGAGSQGEIKQIRYCARSTEALFGFSSNQQRNNQPPRMEHASSTCGTLRRK